MKLFKKVVINEEKRNFPSETDTKNLTQSNGLSVEVNNYFGKLFKNLALEEHEKVVKINLVIQTYFN